MRTIAIPVGLTGEAWIQPVRVRYLPGDSYDLHDHAFTEIFWIENGVALQRINGISQQLEPGTLTLLRAGDRHEYATVSGFTMVNIIIRTELLSQLRQRLFGQLTIWPWDDAPLPTQVRLSAAAISQLQEAAEALASDQSRLAAEGFVLDVLRLLKRQQQPQAMPAWLERGLACLEEPGALAAGALPALCQRTPAHVNRAVRQVFGCTVTELLNRLRLERAAHLLRLSTDGIATIALSCGYASLAHFYRAFQQKFKQTPRAFRHGHQASGMAVPTTWRAPRVLRVEHPRRRA